MSDKYIIKNCPAAFNTRVDGTYCNDVEITNGKNTHCQYITDCTMKCIKSKLDYLKCYINNDDSANLSKMNEIIDSTLQLLDIQEVE